ncbi:MAG TPA: DUF4440 domain-containing protein [Daejeonella sp.]|nr:DUF4440 domain-containing protein [Daejeonella sp.]
MRKCFLILLFLLIVVNSYAQDDRRQIFNLLEEQRQAWNQGNLEGYMQGYWQSDSLLFVGKSGPRYGWKNTLDNYKRGYPDKETMGILTFDIREVRMMGNGYAFVLGAWHLKRKNDEPAGFFTLFLRKIRGSWKIIADHSS